MLSLAERALAAFTLFSQISGAVTTLALILISSPGDNIMSVTSHSVMRAIGQGIFFFFLNKCLLCDRLGRGNMIAILRYACVKLTLVLHN